MALYIPDDGLTLECSDDVMSDLPIQAFAITIDDDVIEEMIRCAENGEDIELQLGSNPVSLSTASQSSRNDGCPAVTT